MLLELRGCEKFLAASSHRCNRHVEGSAPADAGPCGDERHSNGAFDFATAFDDRQGTPTACVVWLLLLSPLPLCSAVLCLQCTCRSCRTSHRLAVGQVSKPFRDGMPELPRPQNYRSASILVRSSLQWSGPSIAES